MIIKYGDGWIKFPDVVWEPSSDQGLWVSRAVTPEDIKERKKLATSDEPLPEEP